MITLIYRLLLVIILFFVVWNLFDEEEIFKQANAAMLVIPLILRILMIK
ncbi:MAG: hypothetical protein Q4E36_03460 [Bacillota bacterium]|nr:hypothetical protein [Bacillota bacterium]